MTLILFQGRRGCIALILLYPPSEFQLRNLYIQLDSLFILPTKHAFTLEELHDSSFDLAIELCQKTIRLGHWDHQNRVETTPIPTQYVRQQLIADHNRLFLLYVPSA